MTIIIQQERSEPLARLNSDYVPANGDTSLESAGRDMGRDQTKPCGHPTEADRRHRTEFAEFARGESHEEYRTILARFYSAWEGWNQDYFEGKLAPPHILLAEPKNPRALGDHSLLSGWGSTNQTRLRPSILNGTHPRVRPGQQYAEGRLLLALDILLHESVHQYQFEVLGQPERSYRGHGPIFRGLCNGIGSKLGLPTVRTAKARGPDKKLPSCSDWPIGVRPKGYYLQAFIANSDELEADGEPGETAPAPPRAFAEWIAENPQLAAMLSNIVERISALLDRFFEECKVPPTVMDQAVTFLAKSYRHRRRKKAERPAAAPAFGSTLPSAK